MSIVLSTEERIRLRLVFESAPPKFPLSSKYLILIDREKCKTIQDLQQTIIERLRFSRRSKFHLTLDDFTLVPSESTVILKDEDCLNIRYLGKEKVDRKRKLPQDISTTHISDVSTSVPSKCRRKTSPKKQKNAKKKIEMKSKAPTNHEKRIKKITAENKIIPSKIFPSVVSNGVHSKKIKLNKCNDERKQQKVIDLTAKKKTPDKRTQNGAVSLDSSSSSTESSDSESSEEKSTVNLVNVQPNNKLITAQNKPKVPPVQTQQASNAPPNIPPTKPSNTISPKPKSPRFTKVRSTQNKSSKVQHIKFDSDSEEETAGNQGNSDIVENAIRSKENAFKNTVPHQAAVLHDWLNSSIKKLTKKHAKSKMEIGQSNAECKDPGCNTNVSVVIKNPVESVKIDDKMTDSKIRPERNYNELNAAAWPPKINSTIAYKLLEMSQNYTPEITDYKEALVQEVYPSNVSPNGANSIRVKVIWPPNQGRRSGRFEMEIDEDDPLEDMEPLIEWQSLIGPKIILSG